MATKSRIPKKIIKELDIKEEDQEEQLIVTAVVEPHQIKLPVPSAIRVEIDMKKGKKLKVHYDSKKRQIIYQL